MLDPEIVSDNNVAKHTRNLLGQLGKISLGNFERKLPESITLLTFAENRFLDAGNRQTELTVRVVVDLERNRHISENNILQRGKILQNSLFLYLKVLLFFRDQRLCFSFQQKQKAIKLFSLPDDQLT